jgi:hypothetical protein
MHPPHLCLGRLVAHLLRVRSRRRQAAQRSRRDRVDGVAMPLARHARCGPVAGSAPCSRWSAAARPHPLLIQGAGATS